MQTNDAFSIDVKDKARSVVMRFEATSASRGERDEVELTENGSATQWRDDAARRLLRLSPLGYHAHRSPDAALELEAHELVHLRREFRGSSLNTSLQNPEMMMPTAVSGSMPRCWK